MTEQKFKQKTKRLALEAIVKEADGPAMTGRVAYGSLTFVYRIVRLWEKTPEELLSAPRALLPLAPLTNVSAADLPAVVQRMEQRIEAEAPAKERGLLWTTTWMLLGLKYDAEFARDLLKGVRAMKESSTYQYTLEEGRVEGREQGREQGKVEGREQGKVEEARRILFLIGVKRLGEPDAVAQNALQAILSQERLEQLIGRVLDVESWQDLLN